MHQLRLSSSKQSSVGAKDNSKAEERARRAWCMGDNACQGAAGGGQGLRGIQHWAPEGEKVNLSKLQRFYLKLCPEVVLSVRCRVSHRARYAAPTVTSTSTTSWCVDPMASFKRLRVPEARAMSDSPLFPSA